jgi:hypothetical protein
MVPVRAPPDAATTVNSPSRGTPQTRKRPRSLVVPLAPRPAQARSRSGVATRVNQRVWTVTPGRGRPLPASRTSPSRAPEPAGAFAHAPGNALLIGGTLNLSPEIPSGPTSMSQVGGAIPSESNAG